MSARIVDREHAELASCRPDIEERCRSPARIAGHGEVPLLVDLMEGVLRRVGLRSGPRMVPGSFRHFLSDPSLGRTWVLFDGANPRATSS